MKCGYCRKEFPEEHLYGLAAGGVRQCPPCVQAWCDSWESEIKQLTDVVRERNRKPLARFYEWQEQQRQERQELN